MDLSELRRETRVENIQGQEPKTSISAPLHGASCQSFAEGSHEALDYENKN